MEARSRTDYKMTSDDESQAEIAEGLSARIKEAETESRADRAMSDAYSSMIRAGIGWVEVSRANSIRSNIRIACGKCTATRSTGTGHRRSRICPTRAICGAINGLTVLQAAIMFPDQAELIGNSWSGWNNLDVYEGNRYRMARAYEIEQAWGHGQEDYLNRKLGNGAVFRVVVPAF